MTYHPISHEGTNGSIKDTRYTIALEYCGHHTPRHVLRFCGNFIAQSRSRSAMVLRAVGHNAQLNGAQVIEEVTK